MNSIKKLVFGLQLAWHPKREGSLAFGTDDGKVGVYDVFSNKYVFFLNELNPLTCIIQESPVYVISKEVQTVMVQWLIGVKEAKLL